MSNTPLDRDRLFEAYTNLRERMGLLAQYQQRVRGCSGLGQLMNLASTYLRRLHPDVKKVWYSSGLWELAQDQVQGMRKPAPAEVIDPELLRTIIEKLEPREGGVFMDAGEEYLGILMDSTHRQDGREWVVLSGASAWKDEYGDDLLAIMVPIQMMVHQIRNQELNQSLNQWGRTATALGSAVARNAVPLRFLLEKRCKLASPHLEDAKRWLTRLQNVTLAFQSMEEFPQRPSSVQVDELMRALSPDLDLFDIEIVDKQDMKAAPDIPLGRQSALFMLLMLLYRAVSLANPKTGHIRIKASRKGLSLEGGHWPAKMAFGKPSGEHDPEQWMAVRLFEGPVGGRLERQGDKLWLKWAGN